MRHAFLALLTAACIVGAGSKCHGQQPDSVQQVIGRALINIRSDHVNQSETGAVQISELVESGRISPRHGEGRQLVDSLFTIAATDERWNISAVAVGLLEHLDSVAGAPRLIAEARWLHLYEVVQHSSVRYGLLHRFNEEYPGPEGIPILGQLAVLGQDKKDDLEGVFEFMRERGPAGMAELLRLLDAGAFTNPEGREHLRLLLGLDDGEV